MTRFYVQPVSVGAAGVTARPAVCDSATGRTVKVYRRTDEHVANALAARLNDPPAHHVTLTQTPPSHWDRTRYDAECACGWSFNTLSPSGRTHAVASHRRSARRQRDADLALLAERGIPSTLDADVPKEDA